MLDSTNVGPVQTSDQYKHRTSKNVRLVQTSDQYKRWTGTFIRKNVGLRRKKYVFYFQIKILVNSLFSLKKIPNFLLLKIHNLTKSGYMDEETVNYIEVKQGGRHLFDSNQLQKRNPTKPITNASKGKIRIKLYDLVEFIVGNFLKQWSIQNLPSPTFFLINVPVRRLY